MFAEGELKSFFRPDSFIDNWPMPDDGEEFEMMTRLPAAEDEWQALEKTSHLDPLTLRSLKGNAADSRFLEAFETEIEGTKQNGMTTVKAKISKIWWIDPQTNQQMEIAPAALHHDVDRRAHLVFATKDKQIWAATFSPADAPTAQTGASE